ncbi:DoxX family membrane protein [Hoyosella subflava]|nr:DoxX family membrane protein [Hoyosella subflava]
MTDKRDDASDPQPYDAPATAPSPFDQNTEEIPAKGAADADSGPATEAIPSVQPDDQSGGFGRAAGDSDTAPGFAWSRPGTDTGAATAPVATPGQYSAQVTRGRPPRPSATAGYTPLVDDDDLGLRESEATEQIPVQDPAPPQAYSSAHTEILERPEEMSYVPGGPGAATGPFAPQQPYGEQDLWGAGAAGAQAAYSPTQDDMQREPVAVPPAQVVPEGRGTLEFGLFILRLLVGGALIADGVRHLLGQSGGLGMGGLETLFTDAGYQSASIVAIAVMSAQIGGGLLLLLGLATPVGAAVSVAALMNVWLAHQTAEPGLQGIGTPELEVALVLAVAAGALALTGPGRISMERSAGWSTRPRWGSSVLLFLGIVGGACAWIFLSGQV